MQVYPSSVSHCEDQPSPSKMFPSSQSKELEDEIMPSPQIIIQISGEFDDPPTQLYPSSVVHDELQPSPETVLPSSHCAENLIPSPHVSLHAVAGLLATLVVHIKPVSFFHVLLHPSWLRLLPSSHCSETESRMPSPQIGEHMSARVAFPPTHAYPVSVLQLFVQPSPDTVLPSSQ